MAKAEEGSRKLSALRNSVLQSWQKEGRSALPHLERSLLARQGAATLAIGQTLDLLLASAPFSAPRGEPIEPIEPDDASACPANAPAETVSSPESPSLKAPPIADLSSHASSSVSASSISDLGSAAFAARSAALLDLQKQRCVQTLTELPCPWPDVRVLLHLLAVHLTQFLAAQGADPLRISGYRALLEEVGGQAADLRVERMQRQLDAQGEELLVAQHLAGRFLANASHEIRTPLTAVLGFAELLIEENYGPLNPEQRIAVGHIENSAQNLLEIISNLLDMLHVRAGKRELQYRTIEVQPVLESVYQILVPLSERKKVRFDMELASDLGRIEADEHILRHIVYHLLSSALRATPSGGQVTLRAWRADSSLEVEMHDTAVHLPPEALANMMEPFSRLEDSPARGYESWEIGLPLVRRYVEMHQGTLEIESLPDRGSVFRVYLPLAKEGKREKAGKK